MTIAGFAMRVTNPAYPPERVTPGNQARLGREDWETMTSAARDSPEHVSKLARWERIARERLQDAREIMVLAGEQPDFALSDEQIRSVALQLKSAHYRRMQAASVKARLSSPPGADGER